MFHRFRRSFEYLPNFFRGEVLGINRRNLEYLFEVNERVKYPLVDNKLLTKQLLISNNLPCPRLWTAFNSQSELRELSARLHNLSSFAVKPARGTCGRGIVILQKKGPNVWSEPGGKLWNLGELRQHVSSIISGLFSLAAQPDAAFIEEQIEAPVFLRSIVPYGLPDIRIIVYRGFPAMAMSRLPTLLSKGRANLSSGAIGVGIDTMTGRMSSGVYRHRTIITHPDTGHTFTGIEIPRWNDILSLAVKASDVVGIGLAGVDIVLDKNSCPLVMELNARPGLSIQIVNSAGLLRRLRNIDEQLKEGPASPPEA